MPFGCILQLIPLYFRPMQGSRLSRRYGRHVPEPDILRQPLVSILPNVAPFRSSKSGSMEIRVKVGAMSPNSRKSVEDPGWNQRDTCKKMYGAREVWEYNHVDQIEDRDKVNVALGGMLSVWSGINRLAGRHRLEPVTGNQIGQVGKRMCYMVGKQVC